MDTPLQRLVPVSSQPFTSLPLASLDRMRLQQEVTVIGQTTDQSRQEELSDG